MARNLWKVIQKQEKKIEDLETTIAALQLRIACLESKDISKAPYKFTDDWWRHQPTLSAQEIKDTLNTIKLADEVEKILGESGDIKVEFNNPIAKFVYKGEL